MQIPEWMAASADFFDGSQKNGLQKLISPHHFIDKTLKNLSSLLETTVFSDKFASVNGYLQKLDPRVKVITIFILLILINITLKLEIIFVMYILVLFIALISKVPMRFFLKRVWIFIPIFAGLVSLPSILNIFTPGDPLVIIVQYNRSFELWGYSFNSIEITRQGVWGAIRFVLRVATSVSFVVLLTLTTRWVEILKALQNLGVSSMFILVLSMTYQYILLLTQLIQDMYLAKISRTIPQPKFLVNLKNERIWVSTRIGAVFQKSYAMINEVHESMTARGFHGEIKLLQTFHVHTIDVTWIVIVILMISGVSYFNLMN